MSKYSLTIHTIFTFKGGCYMGLFTKLLKEKTSTLLRIIQNPKQHWKRKDTAQRILRERELKKEIGTKDFNKNKELYRQHIQADVEIERRQNKLEKSNIPSMELKEIVSKTENVKIIERQLQDKKQWLKETKPSEIKKAIEQIKTQVKEKYANYYNLSDKNLDAIANELYLAKRGTSEYLVLNVVEQYARELTILEHETETNFVRIQ